MKLYKSTWYPERKSEFEVKDKTVVDILTMPERSSINRGYYDEDFERQDTRPFAVNYAWKKGDRSPVLRGFEFDEKLYEIDADNRLLIPHRICGYLFYDIDKTFNNSFVFEGTLDEFLDEFVKVSYEVEKV